MFNAEALRPGTNPAEKSPKQKSKEKDSHLIYADEIVGPIDMHPIDTKVEIAEELGKLGLLEPLKVRTPEELDEVRTKLFHKTHGRLV